MRAAGEGRERVELVYRILGGAAARMLHLLVRRDFRGARRIPARGPIIVAANHISNFDPVTLGGFLISVGRWPRFLSKDSLWRVPVIGALARATGQIPVERHTIHAMDALVGAEQVLERGGCVVIYPEGTLTADPDLWPMAGRRGAAILALGTGVPVFPVAQWGAHQVMPGRHPGMPRFWPRRTSAVLVGEPIRVEAGPGESADSAVRRGNEAIMAALTDQLASLRGVVSPKAPGDSPRIPAAG